MRYFQVLSGILFLAASSQAFADHEGKNGPCKSYFETCKSDSSVTGATGKAKWKAMNACVTSAAKADTANGQSCLDAQAKHKDHHHKGGDDSAAAAPNSN